MVWKYFKLLYKWYAISLWTQWDRVLVTYNVLTLIQIIHNCHKTLYTCICKIRKLDKEKIWKHIVSNLTIFSFVRTCIHNVPGNCRVFPSSCPGSRRPRYMYYSMMQGILQLWIDIFFSMLPFLWWFRINIFLIPMTSYFDTVSCFFLLFFVKSIQYQFQIILVSFFFFFVFINVHVWNFPFSYTYVVQPHIAILDLNQL